MLFYYNVVSFLLQKHTAANISAKLKAVLSQCDLDIADNIVAITTDSAANMILAGKLLNVRRLPCVAHIVHNFVQTAIDKTNLVNILAKIKKIVYFFNCSTTAKNDLDEARRKEGKTVYGVTQSCPTRWKSEFSMMERFIELKNELQLVIMRHPNCEAMLNAVCITEVLQLLKPFKEFTIEMSAEKTPTAFGNSYGQSMHDCHQ